MWREASETTAAHASPCFLAQDKLGKDLYIVEFFFEICFFSTLLFSYYSLVGSDSDLMSSIQADLSVGKLLDHHCCRYPKILGKLSLQSLAQFRVL